MQWHEGTAALRGDKIYMVEKSLSKIKVDPVGGSDDIEIVIYNPGVFNIICFWQLSLWNTTDL